MEIESLLETVKAANRKVCCESFKQKKYFADNQNYTKGKSQNVTIKRPQELCQRSHRSDQKRNNQIYKDQQVPSTSGVKFEVKNHRHSDIQKPKFALSRSSTPSKNICFHCEHGHSKPCCLYVYDTPEDGPRYADWKYEIDIGEYFTVAQSKDFLAGNSSFSITHTPEYTLPEAKANIEMMKNFKPVPVIRYKPYSFSFFLSFKSQHRNLFPANVKEYCNPNGYVFHPLVFSQNFLDLVPYYKDHVYCPVMFENILHLIHSQTSCPNENSNNLQEPTKRNLKFKKFSSISYRKNRIF